LGSGEGIAFTVVIIITQTLAVEAYTVWGAFSVRGRASLSSLPSSSELLAVDAYTVWGAFSVRGEDCT
jgi:hypothetical protein